MNYVETVADLFLKRSGYAILSVADYVLVAEWEKEEIPLDVVLDSINRVFDNLAQSNGRVNLESIGYFQNEVKKNFADWLQKLKRCQIQS